MDDFPAVWAVLLRDVPHRFVDGTANVVFPAKPAVVVVSEQVGDEGGIVSGNGRCYPPCLPAKR
ncbi:MAG: hypothetical protein M5U34_08940 [Chloroflexi bacterium]|nr:hypothetical protein [Chloroflexota bacterium]